MSGKAWRSCGKKTRYRDEYEAMRMRSKAEVLHGAHLKVYPCNFCNGWHLAKVKQYA